MADLDPDLSFGEFDAVAFERWRAAAEKALGAPLDSTTARGGVLPLLPDDDRPPGSRALWERGGWRVGQEITAIEPGEIAAHLLEARGGLDVAWIALGDSLRAGCVTATNRPGAQVSGTNELAPIHEAAEAAGVRVVLQADAAAPILIDAWLELDPDGHRLSGIVADPLGTLAELGSRGSSLPEAYASLATATRAAMSMRPGNVHVPEANVSIERAPVVTALADAMPHHDAGASPAVALGAALAAGLSHLRGLADHGIGPAEAAPHIALRLALGTELFEAIATLRAARLLWAACLKRLGAHTEPRIWARTSFRHGSRLDLPVNLLRSTLQAFAAAVGGVEHLYVQPHTEACGRDDADSRRWARNIQHVLRGESRLHAVADPSAGSPYLEHLTRNIAATAWEVARALSEPDPETALIAALQPGSVVLKRERTPAAPMVGVDLHPDPRPPEPAAEPEPERHAALRAPVVVAPALPRERLASPFERVRERAIAWAGTQPPGAAAVAIAPEASRAARDAARRLAALLGLPAVDASADASLPAALEIASPTGGAPCIRLSRSPSIALDFAAVLDRGAHGLADLLDLLERLEAHT